MTNLDSIFKSRDITLPTKVRVFQAMVFPVVMYGCESWTVKKAERRRIDAFELWCWRRLLRVPWTARRSNKSILKEISPGCFLEGMMLKLTLQYFGHLMGVYITSKESCCDPMDYGPPDSSIHGIFQAKNTRVGCYFLLQGIFPTQGSNLRLLHLLHWQAGSLPLMPPGN